MRLSLCVSSENDDSVRALIECVEDRITPAIKVSKSQRDCGDILIQDKPFVELVVKSVRRRFGIRLHREPNRKEER